MEKTVLEAAYGGLLHDVGKFEQRTHLKPDLDQFELSAVPVDERTSSRSHLHAGYTRRFLKRYLQLEESLNDAISFHHLNSEDGMTEWIRMADQTANAIDENDLDFDNDTEQTDRLFQEVRLRSVFSQVDFGRRKEEALFSIADLNRIDYPIPVKEKSSVSKEQAVRDYKKYFSQLTEEIQKDSGLQGACDQYTFDRMNALLYQYTTSIPASTFEGRKVFVSLYDHSKLSSAIAACLASSDSGLFRMVEFDVSGIQKFIFKVTEGADTKKGIARALRGRSFFISMVSDFITASYLHAFGMPQTNIIFNAGGGATILLPDTDDFDWKIQEVAQKIQKALFDVFHTDLTFVWSSVTCNREELEAFKVGKAIELKEQLEEEKGRKFSALINEDFFYEPVQHANLCELCNENFTNGHHCPICTAIEKISNLFTHLNADDHLILMFFFDQDDLNPGENGVSITIGNCQMILTLQKDFKRYKNRYSYIESINRTFMGMTRFITNEVPLGKGRGSSNRVLSFEEICELAPEDDWGDPKMGILKMDVDGLGAVFAYGMDQKTRSLSKYITLSRSMELFFGQMLPRICRSVSLEINPSIGAETDNETMFYINYAGGDDLVIFGPAAGILALADRINEDFSKFTLNGNITISAGIWIQKPKEPIRFGVLEAEDCLEKSKKVKGKHSVTLLDSTLPYEEFHTLLSDVSKAKEAINSEWISRTAYYSLMSEMNVFQLADHLQASEYFRRVPLMLYSLKRDEDDNGKKLKRKKALTQDFFSFFSSLKAEVQSVTSPEDLKRLKPVILRMKLAVMQTRNRKGNNDV